MTEAGVIKVAVIFSGCGVYDGTEITEAVSTLIHLSRSGASIEMFAPDKLQHHTVNHTTGEEEAVNRNILVESARIGRGKVSPLSDCNVSEFDAIVIPGGFGAAKNLSDFAFQGKDMQVDVDVESLLKKFIEEKKVIGSSCIAPTIVARLIPGAKVTVGSDKKSEMYPYADTAEAIKNMGGDHVCTKPHECYTDEVNNIVTCSAFMYNGRFDEIDDSIKSMVDGVISLVQKLKE